MVIYLPSHHYMRPDLTLSAAYRGGDGVPFVQGVSRVHICQTFLPRPVDGHLETRLCRRKEKLGSIFCK